MNPFSSSSDETYLEAYIEQLTTSQWTYQVRRTMDLIRDLDTTCASDLQSLHNLTQQLHTQIENTIVQNFDIVEMKEDENDEIPEDVPDEIDELFGWNNHNNKSAKDIANKKRKRPQYGMRLVVNDNQSNTGEATAMIPTTEELLEYILQQPAVTKSPLPNMTTNTTTTTLGDIYDQIQHLQRNCVQKTHEKVHVAQQAFELIDAQVQRLDQDIQNMELLLQVRRVLYNIYIYIPVYPKNRSIEYFCHSHFKSLFATTQSFLVGVLLVYSANSPRVNFQNLGFIPIYIHNTNSHNKLYRHHPSCPIIRVGVRVI